MYSQKSLLSSITAPLIEIFPNQLEQILGWALAFPSVLSGMLSSPFEWLQSAWLDLMNLINSFKTGIELKIDALLDNFTSNPDAPPSEPDDDKPNDGDKNAIKSLFNILILLIYILVLILRIFVSCLGFIVAIFNIPASTGFLPADMVKGLDYLKHLNIAGMGISVYGFMQSLVYIILVCSIIRVLRRNVDSIKIPKARG